MLTLLLYSLLFSASCFAQSQLSEIDNATQALINKLNANDEIVRGSAADEQIAPETVYISLGEKCSPALNLINRNLSNTYYPFDFLKTPFDGLCKLLASNFTNFLPDKSALQVITSQHSWFDNDADRENIDIGLYQMTIVGNTITKCIFAHDFKDPKLQDYDLVKQKYQRRIERFYTAIKGAKYVYFFRTHLKKYEAKALHTLLLTMFPKTRFTLIVPTNPDHMTHAWQLLGIKEFALYKHPASSVEKTHGSTEQWDHIFATIRQIEARKKSIILSLIKR